MKTHKIAAIIFVLLLAFIYYGCNDAGFLSSTPRGHIAFSEHKLGHLDQNVDGFFELWIRLDSSGNIKNYSLGKFNINTSGTVVDTSGNPMVFNYQGDTNNLYQTTTAFVSVEPPGDNNSEPSNAILLSGQTVITSDSIYATMTITGNDALGATGNVLITSPLSGYIINTPTGGPSTCKRGVWLCDTSGTSYFQNGMQLNAPGWVYEAWLKDKSDPGNPIYYSIGRFRDPFDKDFDGAGPCAGPGPFYSKPGQDWVLDSCITGKPQIQNLDNGNYELWITLEPSYEVQGSAAFNNPFFFKLFKQTNLIIGCNRRDYLYNECYYSRPDARVNISYRNGSDHRSAVK